MDDVGKQQDDRPAPDQGASQGRRGARAGIPRALRELFAPALRKLAKRQARIRRWAGLGSLVLGVGLLAGGLGPVGLSLILVGTAVLLVGLEQSGQS